MLFRFSICFALNGEQFKHMIFFLLFLVLLLLLGQMPNITGLECFWLFFLILNINLLESYIASFLLLKKKKQKQNKNIYKIHKNALLFFILFIIKLVSTKTKTKTRIVFTYRYGEIILQSAKTKKLKPNRVCLLLSAACFIAPVSNVFRFHISLRFFC